MPCAPPHWVYPILGSPSQLVDAAQRLSVDSVAVVGTPRFEEATLQQVAWQLERHDVDLLVAPDVMDLAGPRIRITPVTGMPLLHITEPRISGAGRWLKPAYERVLAVPLLIAGVAATVAIAVAILVDSGRPVFYRQRRIGFGGKEFEMLKFRTMVRGADTMLPDLLSANEHDGPLFKIRNDPRVTRVGRFLRKCSLDELPQLFNVVKGEMVLVGPRPCLPEETHSFGEAARRRFLARPGLTGPVAGERSLRHQLGRGRSPRPLLRRELVTVLGRHDPVPDPARRLRRTRRVLSRTGPPDKTGPFGREAEVTSDAVACTITQAVLGEGLRWDARRGEILALDILAGHVYRGSVDDDGGLDLVHAYTVPGTVGAITAGGGRRGLVLATGQGLGSPLP